MKGATPHGPRSARTTAAVAAPSCCHNSLMCRNIPPPTTQQCNQDAARYMKSDRFYYPDHWTHEMLTFHPPAIPSHIITACSARMQCDSFSIGFVVESAALLACAGRWRTTERGPSRSQAFVLRRVISPAVPCDSVTISRGDAVRLAGMQEEPAAENATTVDKMAAMRPRRHIVGRADNAGQAIYPQN